MHGVAKGRPGQHTDPRPSRSRWLRGASLVAIVVTVLGVWWTTARPVAEVETIRPTAEITAVDIDLDAGTVSLRTGDQLTLAVERRSDRLAGTPSITSTVIDGVVHVTGTCPTFRIGHCGTNVIMTLPPSVAVTVATGAGSIDGVHTRGPIRASTGAGSIELTVTQDVQELSVATGAGSIDLNVPDATYAVSAQTGLGRTRIDVATEADAPRTIVARTEVGGVTIRSDPRASITSAEYPAEPAGVSGVDPATVPAAPSTFETPADLESFLDETMAEHLDRFGIAGATVTVVKDGDVVVSQGYGYADIAAQVPVEAGATVFPTASVAKLFTWTGIMQLVERGELDLDAEVNDYLTAFQIPDEFDEPIRVWHLLSHTAGFEDKPMSLAVMPEDLTDLETALIRDLPSQDWEPGRYTAYNNYSAGLAGYLVSQVSGMSWEDYLEHNVLEPLSMSRTSVWQPTPENLPDGMTKVYRSHGGGLVEADHEIVALAPFGGMVATSHDMANFMLAHLQDGRLGDTRILEEATAGQMHRQLFTHDPRLDGNAHGFWESTEHGQRVLSHLGDHNSSMAGLWLVPDHSLGIYVAYNSDRGGEARTDLWDSFLDHVFPEGSTAPIEHAAASTVELERFEGAYGISRISSTTPGKLFLLLGAMTVSAQDGDLVTDVVGLEPTRWVATGDDSFVSVDGRSRMVFSGEGGQRMHVFFDGPSTGAYTPLAAWRAAPWHDRVPLHVGLLSASLLLSLSALVVWPARSFMRRRSGTDSPAGESVAARWAAATGGAYLLFLVLLVASLLDLLALEFGTSPILAAALTVGIAATVLTVAVVAHTIPVWRHRYWNLVSRIHFTLVAIAFVASAWQLHHWNLLGFHA